MKPNRDSSAEQTFEQDAPSTTPSMAPDVIKLAMRYKWILLAGAIVGLVGGQLAYQKMGPSFQAAAKVLVSKRTTVPLKEDNEHPTSNYGERGEHIALIMTPMIIGEAVKVGNLDKLPSLRNNSEPVQEILESLKVKRIAGSDRSFLNVLEISYESRYRNDATVVVNAVVKAYSDYLSKTHREGTGETVTLITEANDKLLKQLQQKEQNYIAFRQSAPLQWRAAPGVDGQPGDTTNVHQERVLAIEIERRLNLFKQTEVTSKLKTIEQAHAQGDSREAMELLIRRFLNGDGGAGAAAATASTADAAERSRLLSTMETKLLPLYIEEKKLLRDFGDDHPDVKAVRKSILTTREFYRQQGVVLLDEQSELDLANPDKKKAREGKTDLIASYIVALKREQSELKQREQELTALFEKESTMAKDFSKYQLEDSTLNGEIKRTKTLWELAFNRLNEMKLMKDNGGYSLKVVSPAREDLVLKRQMKIVGTGFVGGLLIAFAAIYLRAFLDNTLKSVDDVQRLMGATIIGRVPEINFATAARAARHSSLDSSLYYFHKPGSPEAEAYRAVRTALFVSTHGEGDQIIQVTSPEPQDGKTTLTCNLAVAMAQSGKKILLIDADLRCPKVHKLFGLKQEIGLSDVLLNEIELENALHTTEIPGLTILAAGLSPANPSEMLGSAPFQQLLKSARNQYDFILVDTPPLLAVSDPCVVSANTDALLLVVRLGKNSRATAKRAREIVKTHGIQLLGVVVNGVPSDEEYTDGYGYHSYSDSAYFRNEAAEEGDETEAPADSVRTGMSTSPI